MSFKQADNQVTYRVFMQVRRKIADAQLFTERPGSGHGLAHPRIVLGKIKRGGSLLLHRR